MATLNEPSSDRDCHCEAVKRLLQIPAGLEWDGYIPHLDPDCPICCKLEGIMEETWVPVLPKRRYQWTERWAQIWYESETDRSFTKVIHYKNPDGSWTEARSYHNADGWLDHTQPYTKVYYYQRPGGFVTKNVFDYRLGGPNYALVVNYNPDGSEFQGPNNTSDDQSDWRQGVIESPSEEEKTSDLDALSPISPLLLDFPPAKSSDWDEHGVESPSKEEEASDSDASGRVSPLLLDSHPAELSD